MADPDRARGHTAARSTPSSYTEIRELYKKHSIAEDAATCRA